jgi:rhamnose transport system ATP-binding protein
MSDRVIVMRLGRMVGEFGREGLTPEKLVRAAAGIKEVA